jgi:hypothetical protein
LLLFQVSWTVQQSQTKKNNKKKIYSVIAIWHSIVEFDQIVKNNIHLNKWILNWNKVLKLSSFWYITCNSCNFFFNNHVSTSNESMTCFTSVYCPVASYPILLGFHQYCFCFKSHELSSSPKLKTTIRNYLRFDILHAILASFFFNNHVHIGGVMVSVPTSNAVDHKFEP